MTALQTCSPYEQGAPPHILIMEDEEFVARGLEMVLTEEGYNVDLAFTGEQALKTFAAERYDLLVADLKLPDADGMDVVKAVKDEKPETEVVIITGYASVNSAVDAMKMGVFDYLTKPFIDDEIKAAVKEALKKIREKETGRISSRVSEQESKLIQKQQLMSVLDRTAEDQKFWGQLMAQDQDALKEYNLSNEAKTAILSGDLGWINKNVGELTQKQLMFIYSRLECEAW